MTHFPEVVDDAVSVLAAGRPYPVAVLRAGREGIRYSAFQDDAAAVRSRLRRVGLRLEIRASQEGPCYVAVPDSP